MRAAFTLIVTFALVGVISVSLSAADRQPRDKHTRTQAVLVVVQKLERVANAHQDNPDAASLSASEQREIVRYVDSIGGAEAVDLLQKMCLAVQGDGDAEDAAYDAVFNRAFWRCVERLAGDTSPTAVTALHQIARLGIEPVDAIKHSLDQQAKLVAAKTHRHQ